MGKTISAALVRYLLFSIWALLFLSASSWVLVGSVAYWVKHGWLPPDSAGWAQAIGGLLAVAVAIAVPAFQSLSQARQLREKEDTHRLDNIQATRALIEHVMGVQKTLLSSLTTLGIGGGLHDFSHQGRAAAHGAQQAAAMLREMAVVDLSVAMVHFVVGLREVANYGEFAGSQIERFELNRSITPDVPNQLRANISLMKRWVAELDELEG
ncbi:hypothetical protein ACIQYQ_09860 [Pseudomonas asiatica]|uniref:hypothetical protein n=1 Tax=Pseudomonas asiatica TaxID=2219225 RepID=UPI00383A34DB